MIHGRLLLFDNLEPMHKQIKCIRICVFLKSNTKRPFARFAFFCHLTRTEHTILFMFIFFSFCTFCRIQFSIYRAIQRYKMLSGNNVGITTLSHSLPVNGYIKKLYSIAPLDFIMHSLCSH